MNKVTTTGLEAIQARCQLEIDKGHNLSPLMRILSGIMNDAVEKNFSAEGRPKWQDLAPSTKRARARKGKWPGQILQVSAAGLASSIHPGSSATAAWVGTNKRYAAIHHFGGSIRQYARKHTLYFRANEKTGELGHRFVKKNRSNFSQTVTIGNHIIRIPARAPVLRGRARIETHHIRRTTPGRVERPSFADGRGLKHVITHYPKAKSGERPSFADGRGLKLGIAGDIGG